VKKLKATVVSVKTTLIAVTELEELIHSCGGQSIVVETPAAFIAAIDRYFTLLALVDLTVEGDWASAIAYCKTSPQTKQTPIYAFGSDRSKVAGQAAIEAGVDQLWTRDKMRKALATVIESHLNPPIEYPLGWDEALSDAARQGVDEFNRGDYFEQHEFLEAAWIAETRPIRALYQGILQIGLAFLQIERSNWQGARKMFRRGLPKIWSLPPQCQGIELATFREHAAARYDELLTVGPEGLHEITQRFPQIQLTAADTSAAKKIVSANPPISD